MGQFIDRQFSKSVSRIFRLLLPALICGLATGCGGTRYDAVLPIRHQMPSGSASPSHCSRKRRLRLRQISLGGLLGWAYAPLVAVERSSNARCRAGLNRGYQRTRLRALERGTITQEQAAAKINEIHEIWPAANRAVETGQTLRAVRRRFFETRTNSVVRLPPG